MVSKYIIEKGTDITNLKLISELKGVGYSTLLKTNKEKNND